MKRIAILLFSLLLLSTAFGEIERFHVNDSQKRDVVTFTSKAPLETIVGKTADIQGYVALDPADIKTSAEAVFKVDLVSLKTGIGLRDEHMRDQYLHTDKFPHAVFELTEVVDINENSLLDGQECKLKAKGNFSVHGVTHEVVIPISFTYMAETESTRERLPGNLLHIIAEFEVLLTDYDIEIPKFVILKLDNSQKIYIDIFASTELPQPNFVEEKTAD